MKDILQSGTNSSVFPTSDAADEIWDDGKEDEDILQSGTNSSVFPTSDAADEIWDDGFFAPVLRRRRHLTGSWRDNCKTLVKRLYHVPGLCSFAWRRWSLRAMGHDIAPLTSLPPRLAGGPGILRVGRETAIASSVSISLHADVTIGSRVAINDGVQLLTGSHDTLDPGWKTFAKPIVIKDYAWIAVCSIILPGVTIGRGAVVGAGSVVGIDIPDYSIVSGNPARQISRRNSALAYSPIRNVAAFEAWLGRE
jgi:maltose O-acetyltransferase